MVRRGLAVTLGLALVCGGVVLVDAWEALGQRARGERRARLQRSPQYRDGRFVDTLPRANDNWRALRRWLGGSDAVRAPRGEVPVIRRVAGDFAQTPLSGLRVTWLGHSTALVEIDGCHILVDPQFSRRNSPTRFFGPARFFAPPLPLAELPALDAVLISHDHYDHLDEEAVRALNERGVPFIVPLGVGAHLEYWGVPTARIVELDWWEQADAGGVAVHCTPARHFSGRMGVDMDATLWCGWALVGPDHRVFYSGDSALFPGFGEIGARLGPFDVTLLDCGAYDDAWADVHMGPEQAVAAHIALGGRLLLPVHWGTFDLALHAWTEPAERVLAAAAAAGVSVAVPRPGQSLEPASPPMLERWWPELPWQTAADHPVVSSGLGE